MPDTPAQPTTAAGRARNRLLTMFNEYGFVAADLIRVNLLLDAIEAEAASAATAHAERAEATMRFLNAIADIDETLAAAVDALGESER